MAYQVEEYRLASEADAASAGSVSFLVGDTDDELDDEREAKVGRLEHADLPGRRANGLTEEVNGPAGRTPPLSTISAAVDELQRQTSASDKLARCMM